MRYGIGSRSFERSGREVLELREARYAQQEGATIDPGLCQRLWSRRSIHPASHSSPWLKCLSGNIEKLGNLDS